MARLDGFTQDKGVVFMTDLNTNRPGYKKTWVGWIPEEWDVKRFRDVSQVNPRKPPNISDDMIVGFVPMANVSEEGQLIDYESIPYREVNSGYTYFENGDILVAKITPSFENGKGCIIDELPNGIGFGSTEFHVLRCKNVNSQFVFYHTNSYLFRVKGGLNMTGTAGQKRLPTDYLKNYRIPVPSIEEQLKITSILSTWDHALQQTRALIDAKRQLKRGLMQQLLTGRMMFSSFGQPVREKGELPEGWEKEKLGNFFSERKENDPNLHLLSITSEEGVIPHDQMGRRDTSSDNKANYKVIKLGWCRKSGHELRDKRAILSRIGVQNDQ